MADITSKDVESFGKVLQAIGRFCEDNPRRVLEFLSRDDRMHHTTAVSESKSDKSDKNDDPHLGELIDLNIFEIAKEKSRDELLSFLQKYDLEQLRYIIRRNRFGALKSKSVEVLADHIADQVLKRGVDVFKSHE